MGPSNISHPAPMLVPASSIIGGGPPQSALRSGSVLIPTSHSMGSPMGKFSFSFYFSKITNLCIILSILQLDYSHDTDFSNKNLNLK